MLCGLIGVGLFVACSTAFRGISDPTQNFSVVFVFYTFWLGLVLLSVLLGDVFRPFNPWRALGRLVSGGFRLIAGQSAPAPLRYPDWLGRWPAVIGVLLFVWLELIAGGGASPTPHDIGVATVIYSLVTFVCMALFGVEEWIERGETFSAYFGMFSRLAPFEAKGRELGIRKFLTGAPQWAAVPEGCRAGALLDRRDQLRRAQGGRPGLDQVDLRALQRRRVQPPRFIPSRHDLAADRLRRRLLLYWLGVRACTRCVDRPRQGSGALIRAHPDPDRARLPGGALLQRLPYRGRRNSPTSSTRWATVGPVRHGGRRINYGIVGSNTVWYVQVAALVIGHVTALTLAHDRALGVDSVRNASRSQYYARGDGRLHLLRAVPALPGERLIRAEAAASSAKPFRSSHGGEADTLNPGAPGPDPGHVGHWYSWVPYVPVVIVLAASFRASGQQRREGRLSKGGRRSLTGRRRADSQ